MLFYQTILVHKFQQRGRVEGRQCLKQHQAQLNLLRQIQYPGLLESHQGA